MTEVTIQVPNGYELKEIAKGKWELVKKEMTLEQILHKDYAPFIAAGRFIVLAKLQCVADYLNEGWKPNWNNSEDKWHIEWYGNKNKLEVMWSCTYSTNGQVVFKTKELSQRAIEICGEDLIKTALGV